MYNMWSRELLSLLDVFQKLHNPFDILEFEQLTSIVRDTISQTIDEYAWQLMVTHNLSLAEARYIIIKQLAGE